MAASVPICFACPVQDMMQWCSMTRKLFESAHENEGTGGQRQLTSATQVVGRDDTRRPGGLRPQPPQALKQTCMCARTNRDTHTHTLHLSHFVLQCPTGKPPFDKIHTGVIGSSGNTGTVQLSVTVASPKRCNSVPDAREHKTKTADEWLLRPRPGEVHRCM